MGLKMKATWVHPDAKFAQKRPVQVQIEPGLSPGGTLANRVSYHNEGSSKPWMKLGFYLTHLNQRRDSECLKLTPPKCFLQFAVRYLRCSKIMHRDEIADKWKEIARCFRNPAHTCLLYHKYKGYFANIFVCLVVITVSRGSRKRQKFGIAFIYNINCT
jgi:hypothetical protein